MRILSKLLQLTHLDPVVHKMVEKLEHERGKPNQVKKGELVAKKNVVEKVDLLLPDY